MADQPPLANRQSNNNNNNNNNGSGSGGGGKVQQGQGRKKQQGRRRRGPKKPADLWRPVPKLPDVEPIEPSTDPTMLLQSLGDPPLQSHSTAAAHYLAAAVERAAGMATALAAAGGLLVEPDDGDPL